MNRKIILFLTYKGLPAKNCGGGNRISFELMNGIKIPGYDMLHINSDGHINFLNEFKPIINLKKKKIPGISKYILKFTNQYLFARIKIFIKKRKLNSILSEFDGISLINAHDSIMLALVESNNIPCVLSIHHKQSLVYDLINNSLGIKYSKKYLNYMRVLEEKSIERADEIVFVSEASYNNYLEQYKNLLSGKSIQIIYNGIDVKYIQSRIPQDINKKFNLSEKKYDLRLVNIANHIKPKNIDVVIKTIAVLKKQFYKNPLLINIGTGPLTADYQLLIQKNGLENNIKFLGSINNEEVIDILRWAEIFIMASENVVFDLVVIEAMAAGCCVVVTDNGGNREIIRDGYNGYLIEDYDPKLFAQKINSSENILATNALETVKSFDISQMLKKYENVFKEILNV